MNSNQPDQQIIVPDRGRKGPLSDSMNQVENLSWKLGLQFENATSFQGGPSRRWRGYRLVLWSWFAAGVDALVLISLSCVFMMVFGWIVHSAWAPLVGNLIQSQHRLAVFAEFFILCSWMYTVTIRSFMGCTLGEWACGLHLGQPHERLRYTYVPRVILRSTIILFSGMFVLPLLSLLLGKDIAGHLCGLKLISKN